YAGFYLDDLRIAADHYRIPPRELEEALPQQVLMLLVAAASLASVQLPAETRSRTGVFIGLNLDLDTTNYHFRWWVVKHAEQWAERLGMPATRRSAWKQALLDAAGPPLDANRVMGGLGSIAASRVARACRLGGRSFTLSSGELSGLHGLQAAVRSLSRGEVDAAVVGAVDLPGDVRAADQWDGRVIGEGAAAVILKRLDDAVRDEDTVYAVLRDISSYEIADTPASTERIPDATEDVGWAGAAAGMAALIKAVLCLHRQVLPLAQGRAARHWLRDRLDGPRRAALRCSGEDGGSVHLLLEEWEPAAHEDAADRLQPLGARGEALFVVEGSDVAMTERLKRLRARLDGSDDGIEADARAWFRHEQRAPNEPFAMALIARNRTELRSQLDWALNGPSKWAVVPPAFRDRIFYSSHPLGRSGKIAFVYPGLGNDFPTMGRELAAQWPEVLRKQDQENDRLRSQFVPSLFWDDAARPADSRERIIGQVALGGLTTDILRLFGVQPDAAIGYSLGESAALFALRAWTGRDAMLRAMHSTTLFAGDLTGRCDAARRVWQLSPDEPVDWTSGLVAGRTAQEIHTALAGLDRVHLLIINTPRECVVGGQRAQVEEAARRLGAAFLQLPETSTVHCPVVRDVVDSYRRLHLLPTTPPQNVRFYSTALGRAYELSEQAAAEAILAQALDTIDFPAVVEAAYQDGIRLFLEMGPGASCSRMIDSILAGRPHLARSACAPGADGFSALLRLLGTLAVERIGVDLRPLYGRDAAPCHPVEDSSAVITFPIGANEFVVPAIPASATDSSATMAAGPRPAAAPPFGVAPAALDATLLGQTTATLQARCEAHAAFLRYTDSVRQTLAEGLAFQATVLQSLIDCAAVAPAPTRALDRAACLEFAVGSIARVLGPAYAAADSFPTRVRLPDEPLMLVDRITELEGEPLSLTCGRVVTEHDVRPDAWYLDAGRLAACVAIEAGQADLFLSGWLGVDFRTRGLAVYRLLNATVTFHGGLPNPGQLLRYDIHIDRFFRQGDTHLFRFRFEGTADGEPLLTMTDGVAGFFTSAELASGKGVVQAQLDRRPIAGVQPDDEAELAPRAVASYSASQIEALRAGDLAGCFGAAFMGLAFKSAIRLPGGRMKLIDRVVRLDPTGGRFGIGQIGAELDILPDAWFL
ncbi:MAG TPA: beta-ketoacyl synthase N-terminal-like domain-containing protein, partial [Gemmataceae bacterium]|nr:beta-ketoacyl synthase N-terminal-like domain-containing protein [Gemmataceae bacterium]